MPRDALAHLSDVIESCDAITAALVGIDLDGYKRNRLVRSSVEREFIQRQLSQRPLPTGPSPSSRSRAMSLPGALPKKRAYSRLNCEALR